MSQIKRRKKRWICHTLWKPFNGTTRLVLKGNPKGSRNSSQLIVIEKKKKMACTSFVRSALAKQLIFITITRYLPQKESNRYFFLPKANILKATKVTFHLKLSFEGRVKM